MKIFPPLMFLFFLAVFSCEPADPTRFDLPELLSVREVEDSVGNRYLVSFREEEGNRDPLVTKINNSDTMWSISHDRTPLNCTAEWIALDAKGNPWVIFYIDGRSLDKQYITNYLAEDSAFSQVLFDSYGLSEKAEPISILTRLNPESGLITKGTFLLTRNREGNINANNGTRQCTVTGLLPADEVKVYAICDSFPFSKESKSNNFEILPEENRGEKKEDGWHLIYTLSPDLAEVRNIRNI